MIDTEAGDLLKRSKLDPPISHLSNLLIEENDKAPISSITSHIRDKVSGNSAKPQSMIQNKYRTNEYPREAKKGFYSPDNKNELNNSNHHKLNQKDMSPDMVKARVFTEYFSMIDDLVIVTDMKLQIVSNNFSAKIVENVISKFNKHKKRLDMHAIQSETGPVQLDQCFKFFEKDQIRCNEDTLKNLIDICTVLNYKKKKHNPEDMKRFKEVKIDRILRLIENLENGIKISKRQEDSGNNPNHFKKITKLKSSMRAINIKKSYLTVIFFHCRNVSFVFQRFSYSSRNTFSL